jgi:hypothetical protein
MMNGLLRTLSLGFAVVGAIPIVWFASISLVAEVPRLVVNDPCFIWGLPNGQPLTPGACEHGMAATSETKGDAITRLTLIQGGLLLAVAFALLGAYSGRRRLGGAAVVLTVLVSLRLWPSGFVSMALFCASWFFLSSLVTRSPGTPATH